jgi:tetratricopeptide (TPR) repeat protein
MTMKQKIIFIIILILVSVAIISLGSYFGWQWYKLRQQNKIEVNLLKPQVIEYKINEDPKNWPSDFPKTGTEDFEVLSVRETVYSPTWVMAEKTLKTKYSKIIAFNFFKDYLNNTFWKINQEISNPDQIQYSLEAEREGDISITINPAENNSSIINIKYEINPQNPKKPEPRQTLSQKEQQDILMSIQLALSDKEKNCAEVLSRVEDYLKRNPKDIHVLQAKGVCEFESRKYPEAKLSFEKVLAIDSKHEAAMSYLRIINNILSGKFKVTNPEEDFLSKDFVEQKLRIYFNPKDYEFKRALKVSAPQSNVLRFSASYVAKKDFTSVIKDVTTIFKQNNLVFETDLTKRGVAIYVVRFTKTNEPFKGFTISVYNLKPVEISILYEE